jgi:hypothetical protein
MDNPIKIRDAYIEDNSLHGVTEDGGEVNSTIVRGPHVIEVGDVFNTEAGHYEVETIKE